MDTNVLNSKWLWLAIVSLAAISGCCCEAYPLPGECDCPTDARRLYFGTGEEAVRRCPCGPDREYFGLKPTCWRRWPDGWGCGQCDHPSLPDGSCGEAVGEVPTPGSADGSNPFRSKEWEDEHTAPAVEATSPPARVPPAVNAPAQAAPAQSAPTKSAPPELFPLEKSLPANAPSANGPAKTEPPAITPPQSPAQAPAGSSLPVQNPATPPAAIKIIPPQAPNLEAPPARITPLQPPPSQAAPPLKPPAGASVTKRKKVVAQHKPARTIGEQTARAVQPASIQVPISQPTSPQQSKPEPPTPQSAETPLSNRVEQHLTNNLTL